MNQAADVIRTCVKRVDLIREALQNDTALHASFFWIKNIQSRRFAATYRDLLDSRDFGTASRFFLFELYGERDYAQRDDQFARIAGALQRYFPESVVATAVALAELHAMTEELDFEMAKAALRLQKTDAVDESLRYLKCWRVVGRADDRIHQLNAVLAMGKELSRLTRIRGLRVMLRMMRGPAKAAGLHALQLFLETGFDTFAAMVGKRDLANEFLDTIEQRERAWIFELFKMPEQKCATELQACLKY